MLNLFRRLSLLVYLSCYAAVATAQLSPSTSFIDSLITPSSLQHIVQTLAADSFQGRLAGSNEAVQAARFIAEAFKNAGALQIAGADGYFMSFYNREIGTAVNVVAAIPGRSKAKELLIFSAHYDHVGNDPHSYYYKPPERGHPEKGDKIYNGANDNASGISGLIHLIRYFSAQQNNERTLVFIAFSGEEEGLLGSQHMAKSFNPKVIKAMINMDMIGRPIDDGKKYPYLTGDGRSNLLQLLNKKLFKLAPQYGNKYFKGDNFPEDNLYKRSDNYSFARRGVIAHTILTSSPHDIYYHSLNDEWETLDYPFMADVVKAIALACTGLIDGSDTPE